MTPGKQKLAAVIAGGILHVFNLVTYLIPPPLMFDPYMSVRRIADLVDQYRRR